MAGLAQGWIERLGLIFQGFKTGEKSLVLLVLALLPANPRKQPFMHPPELPHSLAGASSLTSGG